MDASELGLGIHWDGVVVEPYLGPHIGVLPPEKIAEILEARKLPSAPADALVKFLWGNNWAAHEYPADFDVPPNTVKILIGFKPQPHLKSKFEEDFEKAREKKVMASPARKP